MNRADLQALARVRLREAKALLAAGFPDGAYYLAGYSLECAVKACIAKKTKRFDFPDKTRVHASHTHSLKDLVKLAELETDRLEVVNGNPAFGDSWELVLNWRETSRYHRHQADAAAAVYRSDR